MLAEYTDGKTNRRNETALLTGDTMKPINADEIMLAMRWMSTQPTDVRSAIMKAWKSVDKCRVDGMWVLVASYRCYNRMMSDTVPIRKEGI